MSLLLLPPLNNERPMHKSRGLAREPSYIRRMKFLVSIDRDEDGAWVAECPAIPGCVSQGKTRDEALQNVKEAIELCLEVRAEKGMPLTVETTQVEVSV